MSLDQFQRRRAIIGLADNVDRTAQRQRAYHTLTKERVVVTDYHSHFLGFSHIHGAPTMA
ncbi:hypothetical protein MMMB2_3140 [Mycobacterium marinum MB2]|nr:hypothetical protein MMMB2_3140 [Mycobacterium marinum MB2]